MKKTNQIINELNDFIPVDDDSLETNELLLDNILNDLLENQDSGKVIPALFNLVEKYPAADFGAPGPIVHTLESFDGQYEDYLFISLNKKPAPLTVLMLNRIINALIDPIVKRKYIDLLHQISISKNAHEMAKTDAKEFYDYQMKMEVGS